MTSQDVEPQLRAEAFSCPYCDAVAHQDWYSLFLKRESAAEVRVFTPEAPLVPARGKSERHNIPKLEQLVERLKKNELTYVYEKTPQSLKVKLARTCTSAIAMIAVDLHSGLGADWCFR
jgi:hypothetical protein